MVRTILKKSRRGEAYTILLGVSRLIGRVATIVLLNHRAKMLGAERVVTIKE